MSKYENYIVTSNNYDKTRVTPGLDAITKGLETCAETCHISIPQMSILDGGCGTGNYIKQLKDMAGKVYGLELNEGMLDQARAKLASCTNVILVQASLTEIPFPESSFDGVIINQVLHHLDNPQEQGNWKNVNKSLSEVHRVLKPGGVFAINTTDPQQVNSYWWTKLIPNAVQALCSRLPRVEWLRTRLEEIGFQNIEAIVSSELCMPQETYLDLEGAFKREFRDGDSTWSLATPEELSQGLDLLRKKIDSNEGESYLRKYEKLRHEVGQSTSLLAYKSYK